MHRSIDRLVEAQEPWAKPAGQKVQAWLAALFGRTRPLKDLLNGVWLGHPVHPMVTDVPVGALTAAALLDLTGQETAADIAVRLIAPDGQLLLGVVTAMLGAPFFLWLILRLRSET